MIRGLGARPLRFVVRLLAAVFVLGLRALPAAWIERVFVEDLRRACATDASPHGRFVRKFLDRFVTSGVIARVFRYVREAPLWQAAIRLDAWLRTAYLTDLRRAVLRRHLGAPGVTPVLVNEVQMALYPHCDLACFGCYSEDERGGRPPDGARIAALFDEAADCGARAVHVIGKGEPFLSRAWAGALLDAIDARPHLFFTVVTHGGHLDEALARRIAGIPNVMVFVSIDGEEAAHDARRGPGSHARALAAMAWLERHGAVFGFSATVMSTNFRDVTAPSFVAAMASAGCAAGIYSRFFPLAVGRAAELALKPADLAEYRARFDEAHPRAPLVLFDLDEVEEQTGCHSRAGEMIHVDGVSGAVTPCIRVPFAPPECRVDPAAGLRLHAALAHPFFVEYRARRGPCPSWCGADLAGELASVERILADHVIPPSRLTRYRERGALVTAPPAPSTPSVEVPDVGARFPVDSRR